MKRVLLLATCSAIVLAGSVTFAQGKGGGPKPRAATAPVAHVTHGKFAHAPSANSSTRATGAKNVTVKKPAHVRTKAPTTHAKGGHRGGVSKPKETARTRTTPSATTTTPGTTLTPVQQKLQRNSSLAQKLQSRLPAGTDLNTAAAGFRNLGQFVAAVNVSNNLGLNFTTLKTAMVVDGKSLGQAIQAQRRSTDGTREAGRAKRDADALIRSTESKAAGKAASRQARDGRP